MVRAIGKIPKPIFWALVASVAAIVVAGLTAYLTADRSKFKFNQVVVFDGGNQVALSSFDYAKGPDFLAGHPKTLILGRDDTGWQLELEMSIDNLPDGVDHLPEAGGHMPVFGNGFGILSPGLFDDKARAILLQKEAAGWRVKQDLLELIPQIDSPRTLISGYSKNDNWLTLAVNSYHSFGIRFYIFEFNGTSWQIESEFYDQNPPFPIDGSIRSVGFINNRLVIQSVDRSNRFFFYFLEREQGRWVPKQELVIDRSVLSEANEIDDWELYVADDDQLLFINDQYQIYRFDQQQLTWELKQDLNQLLLDQTGQSLQAGSCRVRRAISGNTMAIQKLDSIFILKNSESTWQLEKRYHRDNPIPKIDFDLKPIGDLPILRTCSAAWSLLSISGDTLAFASRDEDLIYLVRRQGLDWRLEYTIDIDGGRRVEP